MYALLLTEMTYIVSSGALNSTHSLTGDWKLIIKFYLGGHTICIQFAVEEISVIQFTPFVHFPPPSVLWELNDATDFMEIHSSFLALVLRKITTAT